MDRLKKAFRWKSAATALEPAMEEALEAHDEKELSKVEEHEPLKERKIVAISTSPKQYLSQSYPEKESVSIERDSYHLGLAAGYTGRSIKEIEASLSRIEAQMATKDWVSIKLQEQMEKMEKLLAERLEIKGRRTASKIEQPLTPRMEEVLMILRQERAMSYADLALRMDIGISDLRSLLTHMAKRTSKIERFSVGKAGWVKYKGEEEMEKSDSSA